MIKSKYFDYASEVVEFCNSNNVKFLQVIYTEGKIYPYVLFYEVKE